MASRMLPPVADDPDLGPIQRRAISHFSTREAMTLSRLAVFTHSEHAIDINPDALCHALQETAEAVRRKTFGDAVRRRLR
jgi:hypothetical protein